MLLTVSLHLTWFPFNESERNQGINLSKTKMLCSRHGEKGWLRYQRSVRLSPTLEEYRRSKKHAEQKAVTGEGWCLPRQVPRDGWHYPGFGAGLAVSESWFVSASRINTFFKHQIHRHQTLRDCKNQKVHKNSIREVDTHIFWLIFPPLGKQYGKCSCYQKPMLSICYEKQSCLEIRAVTTSSQLILLLE